MENVAAPAAEQAFILGGNSSTLAFASTFIPEAKQIVAWLIPLAWTPVGAVLGNQRERVGIAADNLGGWLDQTFSADDDRSFIAPLRDVDLLLRVGWKTPVPDRLSENAIVNPEDLPEDVLDAVEMPAETIVQCAVCRRMCVRDHFVWNDRQLCAWDYHASVFGRRGPWRGVAYEDRLFDTVPHTPYVSPMLLDEIGVDALVSLVGLPEETMRRLVNSAIGDAGDASYLAVRTPDGYTLLRERTSAQPAQS